MNSLRHAPTSSASALLQKFRDILPTVGLQRNATARTAIVVLGGNVTHTGALYRIAITALRTGAIEVQTYCPPETAGPLAALAPDIACTASLSIENLRRAVALVIGPGLGKSEDGSNYVAKAMRLASAEGIPIILDASSLFDLAHRASVRGALMEAPDSAPSPLIIGDADEMAKLRTAPALLGHLGCLQWSHTGLVAVGGVRCALANRTMVKPLQNVQHVLAGVTVVFLVMTHYTGLGGPHDERTAAAATAGLAITHRAAQLAFQRFKGSTMVSDVMDEIPEALQELEEAAPNRSTSDPQAPKQRSRFPTGTGESIPQQPNVRQSSLQGFSFSHRDGESNLPLQDQQNTPQSNRQLQTTQNAGVSVVGLFDSSERSTQASAGFGKEVPLSETHKRPRQSANSDEAPRGRLANKSVGSNLLGGVTQLARMNAGSSDLQQRPAGNNRSSALHIHLHPDCP